LPETYTQYMRQDLSFGLTVKTMQRNIIKKQQQHIWSNAHKQSINLVESNEA